MTSHDSPPEDSGVLYTMGCGDMLREHISRRCESLGVTFIVDVRSPPFEYGRSALNPRPLSEFLAQREIKYVDMHEGLGDRPADLSLWVQQGRTVDYERYAQRLSAQDSLDRLVEAYNMGLRICVLDREPDARKSHRARFIGYCMKQRGIHVKHLEPAGAWRSQDEVERIAGMLWKRSFRFSWVYTDH